MAQAIRKAIGKGRNIFVFPRENTDRYAGKIIFTPIEEDRKAIKEVSETLSNVFSQLQNIQFREGSIAAAKDLEPDEKEELIANVNSFNGNSFVPLTSKTAKRTGDRCVLYLPQAIQITDGVQYDNFDLGPIGEYTRQGLSQGRDIVAAVKSGIDQSISSLIQTFTGGLNSDLAAVAAVRTAAKSSSAIEGAVASATGVIVNPNRRTVLRGVTIRRFRFTFKLIPSSVVEAEEIKKIVQFFRSEMYPEDIVAPGGVSLGYKFPRKFEIKLHYKNQDVATKILPSFLENVDVTYNPNSMGMHADGNFPEVDISLAFVEERTLSKRDIVGDNSIGYKGGY
jgi:hypothetical protein